MKAFMGRLMWPSELAVTGVNSSICVVGKEYIFAMDSENYKADTALQALTQYKPVSRWRQGFVTSGGGGACVATVPPHRGVAIGSPLRDRLLSCALCARERQAVVYCFLRALGVYRRLFRVATPAYLQFAGSHMFR